MNYIMYYTLPQHFNDKWQPLVLHIFLKIKSVIKKCMGTLEYANKFISLQR